MPVISIRTKKHRARDKFCLGLDVLPGQPAERGPPNYPDVPIPGYPEFCEHYYEAYFFTGARPKAGRGFLIQHGGESVGFISYSSFHLRPATSELDIWMNSEANCGRGFGTDAVTCLAEHLNKTMGVAQVIIAPSGKNLRAVKSCEKAGFVRTDRPMSDFVSDEYLALYGSGAYGAAGTTILVRRFKAPHS